MPPTLDRQVLHAAHGRLGRVGLHVDVRAVHEGPQRPHKSRPQLHVRRAVHGAPVIHEDRLHRERTAHVARKPPQAHHLQVHDLAQHVHVADAEVRGLESALKVAPQDAEIGAAAEGRVEAPSRPVIQVPHRLADLNRDAAARLRVLADRAAEGHEALGEIHPKHVDLGLQRVRLPDPEHHAPDQLAAAPPGNRAR